MLELNIQLQCKKNDTIEQLQMGVSTIATALALLCRASFFQPSLEKWAWQAGEAAIYCRYPKSYIFVKG